MRAFDSATRTLLRAPTLKLRCLATFYLTSTGPLGNDLLASLNGGFATNVTGWIKTGPGTLTWQTGGLANLVATGGNTAMRRPVPLVIGKQYRVTVKINSASSGQFQLAAGDNSDAGAGNDGFANIFTPTVGGLYTLDFTSTFGPTASVSFLAVSGQNAWVDYMQVQELTSGTYRFCDDFIDVSDGTNVWIGAQPLANTPEIKSGRDLAAEPVTLVLDGNKMTQAGITDPARVLADILGYLYQQRRVDFAFGFSYPDSSAIQLIIPAAALKINTCRLIDEKLDWQNPNVQPHSKLEIVLDSLAARYTRASWRTRSHQDQLEIDPTDNFFSFTADAANTEKTLFWGKRPPAGGSSTGGSYIVSGGGGGFGGAVAGWLSNQA